MKDTSRTVGVQPKTDAEIELIRQAGRVVHRVLNACGQAVAPGIVTGDLEDIAISVISAAGGSSPFLGYAPPGHPPYPAWTCVSVNNEIVHGIPGRRKLEEGDIVTVDVGVELHGFIADSAWTFAVGEVSSETAMLLEVTERALYDGIAQVHSGGRVSDIGAAVQTRAERSGLSVVKELTGHGVGRSLHEDPQIPNYGRPGRGPELVTGMTFAIEPMLNLGGSRIAVLDDGWTIVTADGSRSAHFEHSVAVADCGAQILTNGD
ncbi:MAG: type I methionyl aminopeptidase [Armatimonadetes bacterium]|nr:type I methionyl aminopeptidase [Armatimonadota bacterium]MDE2206862.1 type I methionyl aminopeptidase [Armatimonadota bacterium]